MKLPRRQFLHRAAGAAALPAVSRFAWAQNYPVRPIRLVVPFPPGGAFDTLARPWVEQVKPLLGTMIVENIGGGGSSLGAAAVARARPDGYTILLGGTSDRRELVVPPGDGACHRRMSQRSCNGRHREDRRDYGLDFSRRTG